MYSGEACNGCNAIEPLDDNGYCADCRHDQIEANAGDAAAIARIADAGQGCIHDAPDVTPDGFCRCGVHVDLAGRREASPTGSDYPVDANGDEACAGCGSFECAGDCEFGQACVDCGARRFAEHHDDDCPDGCQSDECLVYELNPLDDDGRCEFCANKDAGFAAAALAIRLGAMV